MKELSSEQLSEVQGGVAFIPIMLAFGKGAAAGAGVASLIVAVADVLDLI